jgi:Mrp family chromosome partitioning ATPase
VLVLDMPPGTGDVQLTICQDLELSGAISVTTPSKLAAADAAKGIEMFTSLGVPTLAIVENMSYFDVSIPFRCPWTLWSLTK